MWDEDDSDVYEVPQDSVTGPKVVDEFDFGDDVSSDDSSDANPPPKKTTTAAKKVPAKPAAQTFDDDSSDEVEDWEDDLSDDEQPVTTTTTPATAVKTTTKKTNNENNNFTATKTTAAPEFDDESESEERQKGPKARSTKKSKQRKQKIKMLEEKERLAAAAKKKQKQKQTSRGRGKGGRGRGRKPVVDSSSDSSDSSDDENNTGMPTVEDRYTTDNLHLFGSGGPAVVKKKAKKSTKITKIQQLHPISKSSVGRRTQQNELKKLAKEIGDYILDLSMDNIVDQNHKPVPPTLKKYQVKDFACTLIAKLAKSLDIQNLQIIETQVHSEISQARAKINKIAKLKKQGRKIKKGPKRVVYQEEAEEAYVDGAYNEGDFDAFL